MFNSPEDLEFIIIDPKEDVSDWKYYKLPHVVCFEDGKSSSGVVNYERFLRLLRKIVHDEGARRKKNNR